MSLSSSIGDKENDPRVPAANADNLLSSTTKAGFSARLPGPKPQALSSATAPKKSASTAVPIKATNGYKSLPNEPLKYKYAQEEADNQAETLLPSEILADLSNSNWKLRLAAMEALQSWLEGDGKSTESELVVRLLSKKPGWKESNFQVYAKMTGIFQELSEKSDSWSRACSALTIGHMSDKLGDIKLKKAVGDALTSYGEKFSLQFVLSHGKLRRFSRCTFHG